MLFHEPVATRDIAAEINKYDIGIYPLKPHSANEKYALPNKFFEFIQARLAIVIGPSSEMQNILKMYELGEVSVDYSPEAIAEVIANLTVGSIKKYKQNSDRAAKALSFDSQAPLLLGKVRELFSEI